MSSRTHLVTKPSVGRWIVLAVLLFAGGARAQVRDEDSGEIIHPVPLHTGQHLYFNPASWLPAGFTPADKDAIEKGAAAVSTPYYVVFSTRPPNEDDDDWLEEFGDEVISDWRVTTPTFDPAKSTVLFIGWTDGCELPKSARDSFGCEYLVNSVLTASDPRSLSEADVDRREAERQALDQFSLDDASELRQAPDDVLAFESSLRSLLGRIRRESLARRATAEELERARESLDARVQELEPMLALHGSAAAARSADYASALTDAKVKRNTASPKELNALAEHVGDLTDALNDAIAAEERQRTEAMILLTLALGLAGGGAYAASRLQRARIRELDIVRPWELSLSQSAVRLSELDGDLARWRQRLDLAPEQTEALNRLAQQSDLLALLVHALSDRVARGKALAQRPAWVRVMGRVQADLEAAFEIDPALVRGSRLITASDSGLRILPDDLIRRMREVFADIDETAGSLRKAA